MSWPEEEELSPGHGVSPWHHGGARGHMRALLQDSWGIRGVTHVVGRRPGQCPVQRGAAAVWGGGGCCSQVWALDPASLGCVGRARGCPVPSALSCCLAGRGSYLCHPGCPPLLGCTVRAVDGGVTRGVCTVTLSPRTCGHLGDSCWSLSALHT